MCRIFEFRFNRMHSTATAATATVTAVLHINLPVMFATVSKCLASWSCLSYCKQRLHSAEEDLWAFIIGQAYYFNLIASLCQRNYSEEERIGERKKRQRTLTHLKTWAPYTRIYIMYRKWQKKVAKRNRCKRRKWRAKKTSYLNTCVLRIHRL